MQELLVLVSLVPKGRDESGLPYSMAWLRHHDRYDDVVPLGALRAGRTV